MYHKYDSAVEELRNVIVDEDDDVEIYKRD